MTLLLLSLAALLGASPAPLRLATYAYPAYDRAQALAPLARLIKVETGRHVEVNLYSSPDALAQAVRERRVDVAMTNLAAFIAVSDDAAVRPIAALDVPSETLERYRGVLVVRRDLDVEALSQLSGRTGRLRYAEVLPGSTSGALVQSAALEQANIDRSRWVVAYAGTHEAALNQLVSDQADIAAMAEAPWRALRAQRPMDATMLVEVWRSEPLPPGPVICIESASTPCAAIAARLVRDAPDSDEAATELAKGWSETAGAKAFVPVAITPYRPFLPR